MEARREDFRREGSAVSEAAVRPRELEKGVCWVGQSLKRMVVLNRGPEDQPVGRAASCEELGPCGEES